MPLLRLSKPDQGAAASREGRQAMRNDLPLDELLARPDSGAEDQLTFEMEAAAQELSRRSFAKMILGAGLLITVSAMGEEPDDPPPRRGRGRGGSSERTRSRLG